MISIVPQTFFVSVLSILIFCFDTNGVYSQADNSDSEIKANSKPLSNSDDDLRFFENKSARYWSNIVSSVTVLPSRKVICVSTRSTSEELRMSIDFLAKQTKRLEEQHQQSTGQIETAKLPNRDGQAVRFLNDQADLELKIDHVAELDVSDFTIEAFFQLRTIDEGSKVRVIAGKWNGDRKSLGWGFGVTGTGSRRKPQTLVLQLVGKTLAGESLESALFSDHRINLNTPYYAAASVKLARGNSPGQVTFHLKVLLSDISR